MSFPQKLGACAALVEDFLAFELDRAGSQPASCATPQRLKDAMKHAVLGGGKRFRPFLVMESASLFDIPYEHSVATAAALECVHCYSLVHDDLPAMDDDDLRRGRLTVHKAFDEWTAILAGDALLTLAFEILAGAPAHVARLGEPALIPDLVLQLARAAGRAGMAGGQQLDLDAEKLARDGAADAPAIARIQAMKTGALMVFACDAGALLGGAGQAQRRALNLYGERLGRAFQIADDLLDVDGDPRVVGKALGKDDAAGKATLVSLCGVDAARAELAKVEGAAIAALDVFGLEADVLRDAAAYISRRRS